MEYKVEEEELETGLAGMLLDAKLSVSISSLHERIRSKAKKLSIRAHLNEDGKWIMLGETEQLAQTEGKFEQFFIVKFQFEKAQSLRFELQNHDEDGNTQFLGNAMTSMGEIMGSRGDNLIVLLKDEDGIESGKILLYPDSVLESSWEVHMKISCTFEGPSGCMGCLQRESNDSYLTIERQELEQENNFTLVYQSETIYNSTTPSFKPIKLNGGALSKGDPRRPLRIKLWNCGGQKPRLLGKLLTCVQELEDFKEFVQNDKSNSLRLDIFQVIHIPDFIRTLRQGWGFNLSVAIDYTASNGLCDDKSSLHYLNDFNQYENAISQVCKVLEPYDVNKQFAVYGFGGAPEFMGQDLVSHCFPLTGDLNSPYVTGLEGILQVYKDTLSKIEFSGPTKFGPILEEVIKLTQAQKSEKIYQIFLILTDGDIHDIDITRKLIVDSCDLPISIIIIGVGNEKFEKMKILDGDEQILRDATGRAASRDIVQFVRYKDFSDAGAVALTAEVLREVPGQFAEFMMKQMHVGGQNKLSFMGDSDNQTQASQSMQA